MRLEFGGKGICAVFVDGDAVGGRGGIEEPRAPCFFVVGVLLYFLEGLIAAAVFLRGGLRSLFEVVLNLCDKSVRVLVSGFSVDVLYEASHERILVFGFHGVFLSVLAQEDADFLC